MFSHTCDRETEPPLIPLVLHEVLVKLLNFLLIFKIFDDRAVVFILYLIDSIFKFFKDCPDLRDAVNIELVTYQSRIVLSFVLEMVTKDLKSFTKLDQLLDALILLLKEEV